MNISKYFLTFLFTILLSCQKTKPLNFYIIDGKIKNYNGKIYLTKVVTSEYYPDNLFDKDSTNVVDGKFEFRLSKKYNIPFPFYLRTEETRTSRFILEPKDQQIIIDSLYFNVLPKIIRKNSTINEEKQKLIEKEKPFLETFKKEIKKIRSPSFPKDSIPKFSIAARKKLSVERNLVVLNFVKEYPNSYFSFWELVISQTYNGYSKELENSYGYISNSIKKNNVSKIFEKNLLLSKSLFPGNYFPELKLKNKELERIKFRANEYSNTSYVLVDFWFSNCGPCIGQFPMLKELYSKYSPKQLKIISISTDITTKINNWDNVIKKHNLPWDNLLDENGVEASPLGINSFPTNYLLNSEGIVLYKNISLIDLDTILKKEM